MQGGGKGTEAPKPTTTDMAIGETITIEMSMQVQAVSAELSTTPPDEYTEPPDRHVAGHPGAGRLRHGSCDADSDDFVLRGADGAEYDTASVHDDPGFTPDLDAGTVNARVPAKGCLVYDVPAGTDSLEYRASLG